MNFPRAYAEWRRFAATRRELNRLSMRELEDIGMNRADIEGRARNAARL